MTGTEIALIITAVGGFIAVVLSSIVNTIVTLRTKSVVEEIHVATNSMKDELVKEVREASVAKGLKQGRDEAAQTKEG